MHGCQAVATDLHAGNNRVTDWRKFMHCWVGISCSTPCRDEPGTEVESEKKKKSVGVLGETRDASRKEKQFSKRKGRDEGRSRLCLAASPALGRVVLSGMVARLLAAEQCLASLSKLDREQART
jgi:hypothetical protein